MQRIAELSFLETSLGREIEGYNEDTWICNPLLILRAYILCLIFVIHCTVIQLVQKSMEGALMSSEGLTAPLALQIFFSFAFLPFLWPIKLCFLLFLGN